MGRVLKMHFLAGLLRPFAGSLAICLASFCLVSCGGSSSSGPSTQGPTITNQPASETISGGQTANLSVAATGTGSLTYQWYQGSSGDTSTPAGTNSSSFTSPPLNTSTSYWVKVRNSAGSTNSTTAVITVVTPPPGAIPSAYLGMQMNGGTIGQQPWPVVPFGAVRLWDADVSWSDVEPNGPTPDFTKLDKWFVKIQNQDPNADILYTFGRTPPWASSLPNDTSCGFAPGSCDPPSDVDTTDQMWQDFVVAVVQHSVNSTAGHIKYYEIWNEAGNPPTWTGTPAQTARMTVDAIAKIRSIDPNAVILSPSVIIESSDGRDFLQNYLQALHTAGGEVDAIAFHGYVQLSGKPLVPEDIQGYLTQMKSILTMNSEGSKPLFDTEASWGDTTVSNPPFTDPDMQAGFVARMYLLQWSENVARFYWYQWNNKEFGTLWIPDPNVPSNPGTVLPPGIAYGQVYQWLVGAVMSQPCISTGSVWTCQLTRSGGYQALAVWDSSQSCSNGNCTTSNFSLPTQYVHSRDLAGNTTSLTGQTTVAIGAKPILLENQ
jgi:Ig-like domain-containing protein